MTVEFDPAPIALDIRKPRFSWVLPLKGRGQRQTAYHILVATTPARLKQGKADLWDSGDVPSGQSTLIAYDGRALESNRDYYWKVRFADAAGKWGAWRRVGRFATALLDADDWKAQWISRAEPDEPRLDDMETFSAKHFESVEPEKRVPMFRKEFALAKPVRRARVFVCGVGLYELRLNGNRVGDIVMTPVRTEFRKRLFYDTYDVTAALRKGRNALGLMLGSGWYNGTKRYWGWQQQWYGSPRAILQMVVEYADGTTDLVVTDETWTSSFGPITFTCIYDGEDYDARLEQDGWDKAGFGGKRWQRANVVPGPGGRLCSALHPPDRITERFAPVGMRVVKPGVYVFDMGQNFTGWVRLKVRGPRGRQVRLRYAETIFQDGALNLRSMQRVRAELRYTLKGKGVEVHEPRFTYCGFQYVELTGYPGVPTQDALEGCFVHTALAQNGTFACASDDMNHIHGCTVRSLRCNLQMGVPTDDTQRGERLGWGADAWASAPAVMTNFDSPRFYAKWINDYLDQQAANGVVSFIVPRPVIQEDMVWSSAWFLIPWWQYLRTGDTRLLAEQYDGLVRYLGYLEAKARPDVPDGPVPGFNADLSMPQPSDPRGYLIRAFCGDHLSADEAFQFAHNAPNSNSTAFFYHDASIMEQVARVLGRVEDARRFGELAGNIRAAYNRKWFDPERNTYDIGTQAALAYALDLGLVPEAKVSAVIESLVKEIEKHKGHIVTGYTGTPCLLRALMQHGRDDLIWQMANFDTHPGWINMLRGKNTVTEFWEGSDSMNHHCLASPLDLWFFEGLAGIRFDERHPGGERFLLKPYVPEKLAWVRASVNTLRGTIMSAWRQEEGVLRWEFTVPANAVAVVHVPLRGAGVIEEGGVSVERAQGVKLLHRDQSVAVLEAGSGRYTLAVG